ncbi:MAG TPA: HypC/HybG/HupF family hydrogenase formation chaperone [Micromonosporaceae bacterium]|jgi:hydrogenase assembly chaperone HypC/HupF|nr:HypC/HybG/HupF family hydrogenase formation chaperone [Micromonosporaceae bacterium]
MCVAYPGRVLSTVDGTAVVDIRGRRQRVVLLALGGGTPTAGDWLLVQSGIALARIDPDDARQRARLLDTLQGGPQ